MNTNIPNPDLKHLLKLTTWGHFTYKEREYFQRAFELGGKIKTIKYVFSWI